MNEKTTAIQTILSAPIVYSVTEAVLKELEKNWATVPDCEDRQQYEIVRIAIGEMVTLRTNVEKRRKELKADSLEYGRRVDSVAKEIRDRLIAIETPLKNAKGKVDDAKRIEKERKARVERERIEAIQTRIQAIRNQGAVKWGETSEEINNRCMDVERNRLNETDCQEFLNEALDVKKAVVNTLIEARDVAQAKEKKEAAERVRQQLIQAEQEKEAARLEQERVELQEQNRKIEIERQRIAEQQAARDRVEADKEAKRQDEQLQGQRFDEIVQAIESHGKPTAVTEAIINNEIPYVKYVG